MDYWNGVYAALLQDSKTPLFRFVCTLIGLIWRVRGCATHQLKGCTREIASHYSSLSKRGCSSVVEHLLAKEDVASSSLVTRSSLRLERSGEQRLSALAVRALGRE